MLFSINTQYLLKISVLFSLLIFSIQGMAGEAVVSGTFTGASDHITTGNVKVVKTEEGLVVILGSDFSLDGAPDPKVGFGKNGSYDSNAQVAHLKSKTGEQRYLIPSSVDINEYNEVYIWCDKFSVPLGIAELK